MKEKSNRLCGSFGKLSKFYRKAAIFAILIVGFVCSALAGYSSANNRGRLHTISPAKASVPTDEKQGCCTKDFDKPHLLAASYYSVKDNLTATLMLNNKGPEPVEVKPTLFSITGERLDVPAVIVAGESFRNIDLRELGALPGTPFEHGSIQLFHLGPDLVIGAQLYLVDEARSLSFDEKLSEFQNAAATQLESVWWLPSQESTTTLILSNTSDLEVTASALVQMGKGRNQEISSTLMPHETRLIILKPENSGKKRGPRNQVGSASINHADPKGSVLARALVEDSRSGYSFSAQFYSPQAGKSSGYQGVGLRLGTVAGQKLNPVVVARNIGDEETYVTGRMPYTTADGRDGVVQLPKLKLSAAEAQSLDVQRAIAKAIASENISAASLEFEYTTAPGTVLMVAQSVSEDGNQVFRVPMWDVPAQRNGTGGYPWFIEGDSSTVVYIKNVTDEEQHFTFSLTYDGGDYSLGVKTIKARQTVAFDLRALRDNQVPDERNQTIPVNATRGKIVWSVRGRNSLALLGRSEQVDLAKGISSSYACFMCCPNSFRSSRISPTDFGLGISNFTTVRGLQRDRTCYGSLTPEYYWGDTWTVDNSGVASVSGVGSAADVTGVAVGTATVTGQWEVFTFTMEHDLDGPYCVESSDMTQASGPLRVTPKIDNITPGLGPVDSPVGISIVGSGFGNSPTVTVGGGGITASIQSASATSISVTLNISAEASGGNHAITVTANGQQSNSMDFYVQIPTKLRRNTEGELRDEGGCGAIRTPTYTLLDQNGEGDPINTNGRVSEAIVGFSSVPSGISPPPATERTMTNGNFPDDVGYIISSCPPAFTATFDQFFTVHLNSPGYAWALSSQNSVSMGRTSAGAKFVNLTFTP